MIEKCPGCPGPEDRPCYATQQYCDRARDDPGFRARYREFLAGWWAEHGPAYDAQRAQDLIRENPPTHPAAPIGGCCH